MISSTLNLAQLRVQAKELLRAVKAADPDALRRVLKFFPPETPLKLAQAQLVIARENGFDSWSKLKVELEGASRPQPLSTFFSAVESGDVALVNSMIALSPELAGAWRKTDYGGWESGLHVAAQKGDLEMAKAMVEAGAEVYAVRQSDYPPVFAAAYANNTELVNYLFEASQQRDHNQPPTYGVGIDIILATRLGMADRVKMHLDRDPFAVFRRGCIGETVLHWPAHNGYVEVVRMLLDAGAIIEADEIGLYGGKPLHWASEHEPTTVELLLEQGANPMSRNLMPGEFEGFTPLHMCASQREQSVEVARLLLSAGADMNAIDAKGKTPLQVAQDRGHRVLATFLESA
ncbi:MAG: ankyrin repeat domain-containing protein [Fimbriimonas sp.]